MHLFDSRFPFAGKTALTHADATADDYRKLRQRLGIARCVIVQPSGYGLDHGALLSGLAALGDSARGVAVISPSTADHDLDRFAACGVVGTRFNLVQRGVTDASMLEAVAARIKPRGWHIQLHLRSSDLLRLASRLASLPVPVVLDHFARVGANEAPADRVYALLGQLMESGNVWLKLSAPYIASLDAPSFADLDGFVPGLAQQYPDRIVWGTDWPHVTEAQKPDDSALLNLLARWIPDEAQRARILVNNPCALYRF